MDEETRENNRLIMDFMGVKESTGHYDTYGVQTTIYYTKNDVYRSSTFTVPGKSEANFLAHAKYHSSWDWIMPVVERIQTYFDMDCALTESHFNSYGLCCKISVFKAFTKYYYWHGTNFIGGKPPLDDDQKFLCSSKLEAVVKAVVTFIKWHNNQPKDGI